MVDFSDPQGVEPQSKRDEKPGDPPAPRKMMSCEEWKANYDTQCRIHQLAPPAGVEPTSGLRELRHWGLTIIVHFQISRRYEQHRRYY